MINPNDSLRFKNVISSKYRFHYTEMGAAINEFLNEVESTGATANGKLFYSLNNVPYDENLSIEFFLPINQNNLQIPDMMKFHSYFSVEEMASICLIGDIEKNTEFGYAVLLKYLEENGLEQATPMFHVFSGDEELPYVFLKVGYKEINNRSDWK